ncbi:MAG: rod shape-determining protein MreC [Clostridiales bacterium]|nr:rod shape-determining protein MreC [Clostridiales bacterium]
MRRFIKSTGFKVFLAVIAVILAGSITAVFTNSNTAPQTSVAGTFFGPLQRFSSYLAHNVADFSLNFKSSASLLKEKEELEARIDELSERLVDYDRAKYTLELYEEFLGVKEENPSFKFVAAPVVGRDPLDYFVNLTLGKGSLHGVKVNDPVIYGKNLVGVVVSVMPTQSKVSTLLNPDFNVGAYETGTREGGFVTSDLTLSPLGYCKLPGLEKSTAISPGSLVVTSGIGGIYPRDIIIGKVVDIANDSDDISSYALIEPAVSFSQLSDVFIIVDFAGDGAQVSGAVE